MGAIFLLRIEGSKQNDGGYRYEYTIHQYADSSPKTKVFESEQEMLAIMDSLLAMQPESRRGNIRNVLERIQRPGGYTWEYPLEVRGELASALGCE